MVAIGLVLLMLAALLVTAIITGPAHPFDVELFGVEMATSNVGLFFSGVAVGGGVLIALLLIRAGMQPRRRRRRDDLREPSDSVDSGSLGSESPTPHRASPSRKAGATRESSAPGLRHPVDRDTAA